MGWAIASENLSKSEVKILNFFFVEPLWNRGAAKNLLAARKIFFTAAIFYPTVRPTSRSPLVGERERAAEQNPQYRQIDKQWNRWKRQCMMR